MTLNATEIRQRDLLMQRAVEERKVVLGSALYHSIRDTFDIRPQLAEQMVEQLTPAPADIGVAAAGAHSEISDSPAEGYDSRWLTGPERNRIARANAGFESVSHTFE